MDGSPLAPESPRDAGAEAVILVLDEERGPDEVRRVAEAVL